jgi:IclR family KDG regulon transcriptional repressor
VVAVSDARLGRLIDILFVLGGDEAAVSGGLGVLRVAELLGREKSQVSRALAVLADSGLVDRDGETLEYRLGWRLFALAARVGRQQLLAASPPLLAALVARLGETVHLSMLDGPDVVTLLSEASPNVVRASDWSGYRTPAHATSAGRALLLDHERDGLLALFGGERLPPGRSDEAPADVDELLGRIVAARRDGFATVVEEFEPGLVGVAAPVRDLRGRVVAAVNVSGPAFRFTDRLPEAGREVRAAADALSARLGWETNRDGPRPDGGDDD